MAKPHTLLGFAFAGADLLLEVGPDESIAFALGAGEAVTGLPDRQLTGRPWRKLVHPDDWSTVQALFDGLDDGERAGPIVVAVATPPGAPERFISLAAIRLPQNKGAISCTLAKAAARGPAGLQSREAFERRAAELVAGASHELELAFVDLAGLSRASKKDPAELEAMLAGLLRAQSYQGEAPTPVGPERYALVRGRDEQTEVMTGRIGRLLNRSGMEGVTPKAAAVALTGVERPRQVMQALRYALNQVMEKGLDGPLPENLSEALECALRATLGKAGQLGDAIQNKRFRLVFQPVVGLQDRHLHHHEALVRFGPDGSPFPTIRIAEELDLIEALDGAVLEEALKALRQNPLMILAVNMSGRSLVSDNFVSRAVKMVQAAPDLAGRLIVELTESAAIDDLALADRRLQALKAAGCEICLDDFGAGAASLAYLQQLRLDMLKIDGRYIRDLQHGGREATFVKHLVNMCAELKIETVAEMVETPETEEAVRKAGVHYAQGWLYGRAVDVPHDPDTFAARGLVREGALAVRSALDR